MTEKDTVLLRYKINDDKYLQLHVVGFGYELDSIPESIKDAFITFCEFVKGIDEK